MEEKEKQGQELLKEAEKKEKQGQESVKEAEKKEKQGQEKGNKKTKKIVGATALAVTVLGAAGGGIYVVNSPAKKVSDFINEGKISEANTLYTKDVKGSFAQEKILDFYLGDTVTEVVKSYESKELSFEEAKNRLILVTRMGGDKQVTDAQTELEYITELNESRCAYDKANECMEQENYKEAIINYKLVTKVHEEYDEAQKKLAEAIDKYRENILGKTGAPSSEAEFEEAIEEVNEALNTIGEDVTLSERLENLKSGYRDYIEKETVEAVNEKITGAEYVEAVAIIDEAIAKIGEDETLTELRETTLSAYRNNIKAAVDAKLEVFDYEEALDIIKNASEELPDSYFDSLYEEVENEKPKNLDDYMGSSYYFEKISPGALDKLGNKYDTVNMYCMTSYNDGWSTSSGYVYENLDGKLSKLSGLITLSSESDSGDCVLNIYGDGDVLLYTSGIVNETSEPVAIDADVSEQKQIKITLSLTEGESCTMRMLLINFSFEE